MARRMKMADRLLSSNLLEAELEATFRREGVERDPTRLPRVDWVLPDRALGDEIRRVLTAGYVRGADCWHLATALFIAPDPRQLQFLTLDTRQRGLAKTLGFAV
jgi:hypothetical protein